MAELDKKIQKAQTDLVQAVLEAQEKRNPERVDMLVTNAIKQLKMSRFKPDQTTCISLVYLARINPKVFAQSIAIREVLKLSLRRDNGPANIKGKNDIVLPVLSANILLACCDATDIRLIILNKIEQWLSSNQKIAEIVQHLLAIICMKCQGDPQTVGMLVEMRHNWLQYLEENFNIYGSIPPDLSGNIRTLLHTETSCASLVIYLKFLIKHDSDVEGLSKELARFIIERPMSLISMLNEDESAVQLIRMILMVFIKLFTILRTSDKKQPDKITTEAVLSLMALVEMNDAFKDEFDQLLDFWRIDSSEAMPITQEEASSDNKLPVRLRQRLIHSSNDSLVELGLQNADISQLVDLIQQFGLPLTTINKIFKRLGDTKNVQIIRSHVKDESLFRQLLDFYDEIGALGAKELNDHFEQAIQS